jgi:hypothetical protein
MRIKRVGDASHMKWKCTENFNLKSEEWNLIWKPRRRWTLIILK